MGLDQYLYASRTLPVDHEHSHEIAMLAHTHGEDMHVSDDGNVHVYLCWYDFVPYAEHTKRLLDLAGLTDLLSDDGKHGHVIQHTDGRLTVMGTVYYWRKTNAVHGWFVDKVQDGVDDCGTYTVEPELLPELVQRCRERDLEPVGGFFFGSVDKDEWYHQDLERTARDLEVIIRKAAQNIVEHRSPLTFAYHSSW